MHECLWCDISATLVCVDPMKKFYPILPKLLEYQTCAVVVAKHKSMPVAIMKLVRFLYGVVILSCVLPVLTYC